LSFIFSEEERRPVGWNGFVCICHLQ